ncbi:MAG: hypothetical protein QM638_03825 [Nocardioides sp.]|uniref:hypothetical protein n=1 Tax=Nocardioides sp. TaxID=35761 RepID=UPI0039E3CD06
MSPLGLRAGVATRDITPASLIGLNPMGGGDFTAVHDPLGLRALVLDDGVTRLALVALDLLEVGVTTELRARIEREVGIPANQILLAPSHSHNAPRVGETPSGGLGRAASAESLGYTETVFAAVLDAVREAERQLRPARLGVARGRVDVNVNRDQLVDGRWVLGHDPDGPSDKTLSVVAIESEHGHPLAVVLNYAVHPTVTLGTRQLGADLAGVATRYVEQQVGAGVATFWTAGALADQAPRVSYEFSARPGADAGEAFRACDAQGLMVGAEAVRVLAGIDDRHTEVSLAGAETVLRYPIKRGVDLPADMHQDDVPDVGVRLTVLRLGEVVLAGVGGEVPTVTGHRIRAASGLRHTLVVSMGNERVGYLADERAFSCGTFTARGTPIQPGHLEAGIPRGVAALLARLR